MVFDMARQLLNFYIIDRGLIYSSYTINSGSQEITANIARILNVSFEEAEVIKDQLVWA